MRKTQKALVFLSLSVLFLRAEQPSTALGHGDYAEVSPSDEALHHIRRLLTDPHYEVTKSFRTYCYELAAHLDESTHPRLRSLSEVLRKIAHQNNAMIIGAALVKYRDVFEDGSKKFLPVGVLKDRLSTALKL